IDHPLDVVSAGLSQLSMGRSDLYSTTIPPNIAVPYDSIKGNGDIVWKLADDNLDEEFLACSDYHEQLLPDRMLLNRLSGQITDHTITQSIHAYADPWQTSLSLSPSSVSLQSVPCIPPSETKPRNFLHSHSSLTSFHNHQSDILNNQ
ncbi:unnamed protein product, partial [Schistosoma turkestanicum]